MEKAITPLYVAKGDTIELIAPSFGCTTEPYLTRLEASIKRLKKEGFKINEGKNIRRNDGVASSAPPKERAEEFMDAYLNKDYSLIISVGGGEVMSDMLPYVDFEAIKKAKPKWFMGFSDNTSLTYLLTTNCNIKTVYGPNAPSFYEKEFRFAQKDALRVLRGERHFEGYPKYYGKSNRDWPALYRPRANMVKTIVPYNYDSERKGTLLGGCLDVILTLVGTRFDKTLEFLKNRGPVIWYLEACDLSPLEIRRGLFQLKEAGYFDSANMFLLGRHLCGVWEHNEIMGVNKYNAATDILSPLGVPLLMDIDLGHLGPSMPIINGAEAIVKLDKGNIIIDYV